jgi:hypothetical protein
MPCEKLKISSMVHLYEWLPGNERIITDLLRGLVRDTLPSWCREKISYNVPFFYGHKGICIIWPASIPRGGIQEGVLFGFWHANKLSDRDKYLVHGTNKQVYYKIYKTAEDIDQDALTILLNEAVALDLSFG